MNEVFQKPEYVHQHKVCVPASKCPMRESEIENVGHSDVSLCDPMDCSLPGSSVHRRSIIGLVLFSRKADIAYSLWRRKWQSTPVLLPGKSHGQRSLIGYSPWGRKESDTTEQLYFT